MLYIYYGYAMDNRYSQLVDCCKAWGGGRDLYIMDPVHMRDQQVTSCPCKMQQRRSAAAVLYIIANAVANITRALWLSLVTVDFNHSVYLQKSIKYIENRMTPHQQHRRYQIKLKFRIYKIKKRSGPFCCCW